MLTRPSTLQGLPAPRQRRVGARITRVPGGAYRGSGSELAVIHLPGGSSRRWKPPIVWCHGAFASGNDTTPWPFSEQAEQLCQYGFPVLCADLGGLLTWGNDDSQLAVDQLIAYCNTNFGTRTDRVGFVGVSMGATTAINWAARHLSRVSFVYGLVPVVSITGMFTSPAGAAFQGSVWAAYGSEAAWLAAAPTHDPGEPFLQGPMASLGDRFRIDASASDEVILAPVYDTYIGGVGTADFRWYPGDHAAGQYHDHREVARWAAAVVERTG